MQDAVSKLLTEYICSEVYFEKLDIFHRKVKFCGSVYTCGRTTNSVARLKILRAAENSDPY